MRRCYFCDDLKEAKQIAAFSDVGDIRYKAALIQEVTDIDGRPTFRYEGKARRLRFCPCCGKQLFKLNRPR